MGDELVERLGADVVRVQALDERTAAPAEREVVRGLDLEVRRAAAADGDGLGSAAKAGCVGLDGVGSPAVVEGDDDDRLPGDRLRVLAGRLRRLMP